MFEPNEEIIRYKLLHIFPSIQIVKQTDLALLHKKTQEGHQNSVGLSCDTEKFAYRSLDNGFNPFIGSAFCVSYKIITFV